MLVTRFIGNYTYYKETNLVNFSIKTTMSTTPATYSIVTTLYNLTDNTNILVKTIKI